MFRLGCSEKTTHLNSNSRLKTEIHITLTAAAFLIVHLNSEMKTVTLGFKNKAFKKKKKNKDFDLRMV